MRRRKPSRKEVQIAIAMYSPPANAIPKSCKSPTKLPTRGRTGIEQHVAIAELAKIIEAGGNGVITQIGETFRPATALTAFKLDTYAILAKKGGQTYSVRSFAEWQSIP